MGGHRDGGLLRFLSTPSARRATIFTVRNLFNNFISIHALREEGDRGCFQSARYDLISIHALREEGDADHPAFSRRSCSISIHALREEGDWQSAVGNDDPDYFYPRPPRGGRLTSSESSRRRSAFLSTPSARRATSSIVDAKAVSEFLSTPSARRATLDVTQKAISRIISIHALREEGDVGCTILELLIFGFLSTPSARRATPRRPKSRTTLLDFYPRPPRGGRPLTRGRIRRPTYFYPRPPRGGRPSCG